MSRHDAGFVQSMRAPWNCGRWWYLLLLFADLGCGQTEQGGSEGGRARGDSGGVEATSGGSRSAGGSDGSSRAGTGGSQDGASTGGADGTGSAGAPSTGGSGGDGGAESGGETGTAGETSLSDLPLPARCKATSGRGSALSCSLDVTCDGIARTIDCHSAPAGRWQCTCDSSRTDPLYLIDGAQGLKACAIGAGLCAAVEEEPEPRDADCTGASTSDASIDALVLNLSCQTPVPVDFARGVAAVRERDSHVDCSRVFGYTTWQPQEPFDCQCWDSDGAHPYTVLANDESLACRELALHCLNPATPPFDGPEACVRGAGEFQDGACGSANRCFRTSPLANGVSLAESKTIRSATCAEDPELLALQCACSDETRGTESNTVLFFAPPNDRATGLCDLAICDPEAARKRTGIATCEPASVETQEIDSVVSCKSVPLCGQAATIAAQDLVLQEYLSVYCKQASDQAWWCSCALAEDTASFELGAAVDGTDACTRAGSRCAEMMTLPLSPHGAPAEAPDPLPAP